MNIRFVIYTFPSSTPFSAQPQAASAQLYYSHCQQENYLTPNSLVAYYTSVAKVLTSHPLLNLFFP